MLVIGEAATYDSIDIKGLHQLSLPLGNDRTSPTLVMLDSCYGGEDIYQSFDTKGDNTPNLIITLTNPQPMFFDLISYSALDASQYAALPLIFRDEIEVTKSIIDHLSDGIDLNEKITEDNGVYRRILVHFCTLKGACSKHNGTAGLEKHRDELGVDVQL